MIELIQQPWHWAVAGILIGLTVPTLLILGNKKFGISSSLRHVCAMCVPANILFFTYDWKKEMWNLFFVLGVIIGGFLGNTYLENPDSVIVTEETTKILAEYGITDFRHLMPVQIFNWDNLLTFKGFIFFVFGGFLVGFGTRYAGGCTSGHAIMGLSNLQIPSLIATISFMVGGFFSANVLLPFLLKWF